MNIYVVVEGEKAAKSIYKSWIRFVNPGLQHIDYLADLDHNNFFIMAGFGQPEFLTNRVAQAVQDVNKLPFNRLVIAIDSEDMDFRTKQVEVSERVDRLGCNKDVRIVVQHFCIETWLLANKAIFRGKPRDAELLSFKQLFDVRYNDPELLPPNSENTWNRAQFAYHYLRAGLRDIYPANRIPYTKKNPGVVVHEAYFDQVRLRCMNERAIVSFQNFLNAFV